MHNDIGGSCGHCPGCDMICLYGEHDKAIDVFGAALQSLYFFYDVRCVQVRQAVHLSTRHWSGGLAGLPAVRQNKDFNQTQFAFRTLGTSLLFDTSFSCPTTSGIESLQNEATCVWAGKPRVDDSGKTIGSSGGRGPPAKNMRGSCLDKLPNGHFFAFRCSWSLGVIGRWR